eukprot:scaffold27797_cov28-Tisochrysis_lutea.AAC.2
MPLSNCLHRLRNCEDIAWKSSKITLPWYSAPERGVPWADKAIQHFNHTFCTLARQDARRGRDDASALQVDRQLRLALRTMARVDDGSTSTRNRPFEEREYWEKASVEGSEPQWEVPHHRSIWVARMNCHRWYCSAS